MTNSTPQRAGRGTNRFTISLILGLLLIPISAVAAVALISQEEDPAATQEETIEVASPTPEATIEVVTTTIAAPAVSETMVVTESPTATSADLAIACGDEGMQLVEREADGSIDELGQAALDALRQICEEEGIPLPGPPEPAPVVRTVTVVAPSTSSSGTGEGASTAPSATPAPDDDGSSHDDEYEDHEDEDEDEDEEDEREDEEDEPDEDEEHDEDEDD